MTRKRVKLALIENSNARKASLKKRRLGFMKKVSELSTLCGVNASAIIYSLGEPEPMVWPSHDVVTQVLTEFQSLSGLEQQKKMTNNETYLNGKLLKMTEQLAKCQRKHRELEMRHLMHRINQTKGLNELQTSEVDGLIWFVEEKMKEIKRRGEFLQQVPLGPASAHHDSHLHLPPQGPTGNETAQTSNAILDHDGDRRTPTDPLLLEQWFIDMMNNNQLKSASSLNDHAFDGGALNDLGLPRHLSGGSFGGVASMGLPPMSFRQHDDMGLPHGSNVGGSSFSPFGSTTNLGLHPFSGQVGSSSAGGELGLSPFHHFGDNNSGAGNNMGFPFDGEPRPNNPSP